jgi:hypothetical protein
MIQQNFPAGTCVHSLISIPIDPFDHPQQGTHESIDLSADSLRFGRNRISQ